MSGEIIPITPPSQSWRWRPDVMKETDLIAEEICPQLYNQTLQEMENEWSSRTLVHKLELFKLFRIASCVRYLRKGITPKWIDEVTLAEAIKFFDTPNEDNPNR